MRIEVRNLKKIGAAVCAAALLQTLPAIAAGTKSEAAKTGAAGAAAMPATGKVRPPLAAGQHAELQLLTHKMMGHINLSAMALHSNLPEAAKEHIATARKLAAELEGELPQVVSDTTLKYGKLTYSFEDKVKDYYVPILDDVFLLSDYHKTYRAFRESDLEETDAGVVRVTLQVDLRQVEKALDMASAQLSAKHPSEAADSLSKIFENAKTDEEIVTDPVWAIYDNLALARNMVGEHHYRGARLVLAHAEKRLDDLEKAHSKDEKVEFQDMHAQIEALSNQLAKDDPTLVESADRAFHEWMTKVRGWLSPSA